MIAAYDDTSLDGIVTTFANMHNEGALDGDLTLMVSECSPVFVEMEGTAIVGYSIFTMGYIHGLFNEGGVRHANAPKFIYEFPGGMRINAW